MLGLVEVIALSSALRVVDCPSPFASAVPKSAARGKASEIAAPLPRADRDADLNFDFSRVPLDD
jgi:hypothetical protein